MLNRSGSLALERDLALPWIGSNGTWASSWYTLLLRLSDSVVIVVQRLALVLARVHYRGMRAYSRRS